MRALTGLTEKLLTPVKVNPSDRLDLSLSKDSDHFIARIYQKIPGSLYPERPYPASQQASHEFLERIVERTKIEDDKGWPCTWSLAATDMTVAVIRANWEESQIRFATPEAKVCFSYLYLTTLTEDHGMETLARFKEMKALPENHIQVHPELPLEDYQLLAAYLMGNAEGFALFMDTGTGKTCTSIARICNDAERVYAQEGRPYLTLAVCPKNVRVNWASEFERFATCKANVVMMRGNKMERIKRFIDTFEVPSDTKFCCLVCSYESMVNMLGFLKSVKWDRAILDEGHYIKNPESKRTRAAHELRDSSIARNILTGTPICNNVLDLWAQLEFLRRGGSGFIQWKPFKKFYGVWEKGADFAGHEKLVAIQNLPFMRERLAKCAYIVRKSEVLHLPELTYDVREVTMTPDQRTAYENLRTNLVHEIESDLNNATGAKRALVVTTALTKLLRLAQITSGFMELGEEYDDMGNVVVNAETIFFNPNPKLDELVNLVGENDELSKVIIWAHWRNDIKAISKRFSTLGLDHVLYYGATSDNAREESEYRFNYDPKCRLLVGSAGAGGTGLNLVGHPPDGSGDCPTDLRHLIYYSQDWSQPKRTQSRGRGYRRGTRKPVRETDLTIVGTIDEEIRHRVIGKQTAALEVSDVQAILRAVLYGLPHDD